MPLFTNTAFLIHSVIRCRLFPVFRHTYLYFSLSSPPSPLYKIMKRLFGQNKSKSHKSNAKDEQPLLHPADVRNFPPFPALPADIDSHTRFPLAQDSPIPTPIYQQHAVTANQLPAITSPSNPSQQIPPAQLPRNPSKEEERHDYMGSYCEPVPLVLPRKGTAHTFHFPCVPFLIYSHTCTTWES